MKKNRNNFKQLKKKVYKYNFFTFVRIVPIRRPFVRTDTGNERDALMCILLVRKRQNFILRPYECMCTRRDNEIVNRVNCSSCISAFFAFDSVRFCMEIVGFSSLRNRVLGFLRNIVQSVRR